MSEDEPFDLVAANDSAAALANSIPDPDEQIRIYNAITFRVALQIVSGDVKFKTVKEAVDAAKVFAKVAADMQTAEAKKLSALAQEDAAEAIKNLTSDEKKNLLLQLERKAKAGGKGEQ